MPVAEGAAAVAGQVAAGAGAVAAEAEADTDFIHRSQLSLRASGHSAAIHIVTLATCYCHSGVADPLRGHRILVGHRTIYRLAGGQPRGGE